MKEYSEQLQNMEVALDETLGDAWDFTLDPLALQVTLRVPSSISLSCILYPFISPYVSFFFPSQHIIHSLVLFFL